MKNFAPTIQLVKVPVTSLERACAFYRDVMGLEQEFAVEEYGWAQYILGDIPLCLYVVGRGGGEGEPGGEMDFHLSVDDVKKAYDTLKDRGATFACDLVTGDDGSSFFMIADPDGNAFKVMQR